MKKIGLFLLLFVCPLYLVLFINNWLVYQMFPGATEYWRSFVYACFRHMPFELYLYDNPWFFWPLKTADIIEFGVPYGLLVNVCWYVVFRQLDVAINREVLARNRNRKRLIKWILVFAVPLPITLFYWRILFVFGIPGFYSPTQVSQLGIIARIGIIAKWHFQGILLHVPYGILTILLRRRLLDKKKDVELTGNIDACQ